MPAAILSLLGPLVGPILAVLAILIAAVAAYFGIKQKGVQQERQKQQAAQAKAVQQVQQKLQVAASKDVEIDQKVQDEISKADAAAVVVDIPSSPDKFRF